MFAFAFEVILHSIKYTRTHTVRLCTKTNSRQSSKSTEQLFPYSKCLYEQWATHRNSVHNKTNNVLPSVTENVFFIIFHVIWVNSFYICVKMKKRKKKKFDIWLSKWRLCWLSIPNFKILTNAKNCFYISFSREKKIYWNTKWEHLFYENFQSFYDLELEHLSNAKKRKVFFFSSVTYFSLWTLLKVGLIWSNWAQTRHAELMKRIDTYRKWHCIIAHLVKNWKIIWNPKPMPIRYWQYFSLNMDKKKFQAKSLKLSFDWHRHRHQIEN